MYREHGIYVLAMLKCSEEVADCIGNVKTYGECLETLR